MKQGESTLAKQAPQTKVEVYSQAQYDLWLASKPDFAAVTDFWAENLPGVTALPDLPAVTTFRADAAIRKPRK